jgi:acyl-coenzyme A thioesterase PaaI-like protein
MEVELHADVIRRGTRLAFLRCEAWRVGGHNTRLIATAKVTKSLSTRRND